MNNFKHTHTRKQNKKPGMMFWFPISVLPMFFDVPCASTNAFRNSYLLYVLRV